MLRLLLGVFMLLALTAGTSHATDLAKYQLISGSRLTNDVVGGDPLVQQGSPNFLDSPATGTCGNSGAIGSPPSAADYVSLPASVITGLGTNSVYSISLTARVISGSFNILFGSSVSSSGYCLYSDGTNLRWFDGTSDQVAGAFSSATCHTVVVQGNGSNTLIYIDGSLVSTRTLSTPWSTDGLNFGNRGGSATGAFNGALSYFVITAGAAGTPTDTPTASPTFTISPTATPTPSPSFTASPLVTYTPAPRNAYMPLPVHGFIPLTLTTAVFESTIDYMVSAGYVAAGWNMIAGDAGSFKDTLDVNGNLQDAAGIDWATVTAYAHARGVNVEVYLDAGTLSCAAPNGSTQAGSYQHEFQHLAQLASKGFDGIHLDLCNLPSDPNFNLQNELNLFSAAVAAAGRPMTWTIWGNVFNTWFPDTGANAWSETLGPVGWDGAGGIVGTFFGGQSNGSYTGPYGGGWGFPMIVWDFGDGIPGLTDAQYKAQIDMWSMLASPIWVYLNGYALQDLSATKKSILQNSTINNKVDRDPLGIACVTEAGDGSTYVSDHYKPLTNSAWAFAFFNQSYTASAETVHFSNIPGAPSTMYVDYVGVSGTSYLGPFTTSYSRTVSAASADILILNSFSPTPTPSPSQRISPYINPWQNNYVTPRWFR